MQCRGIPATPEYLSNVSPISSLSLSVKFSEKKKGRKEFYSKYPTTLGCKKTPYFWKIKDNQTC